MPALDQFGGRRQAPSALDAAEAARLADAVAPILAEETGRPQTTDAFKDLAAQYRRLP